MNFRYCILFIGLIASCNAWSADTNTQKSNSSVVDMNGNLKFSQPVESTVQPVQKSMPIPQVPKPGDSTALDKQSQNSNSPNNNQMMPPPSNPMGPTNQNNSTMPNMPMSIPNNLGTMQPPPQQLPSTNKH